MHWFILIALWGFIGYGLLENIPLDYFYYVWVPIGIAFIVWGIHIEKRKMKQKLDEENKVIQNENKIKQSLLEKYNLPIDCPSYKYLSGYNNIPNKNIINIWIKENKLNLLVNGENMQKHEISLEDINFYSVKGDIRQESENTGGDATLGETVIAEGLLGTAAAMRKNQVVQNIKTIDERKTIINATIEGKNSFIFFEGVDLYNYLLENMPEKEQSFIAMNK